MWILIKNRMRVLKHEMLCNDLERYRNTAMGADPEQLVYFATVLDLVGSKKEVYTLEWLQQTFVKCVLYYRRSETMREVDRNEERRIIVQQAAVRGVVLGVRKCFRDDRGVRALRAALQLANIQQAMSIVDFVTWRSKEQGDRPVESASGTFLRRYEERLVVMKENDAVQRAAQDILDEPKILLEEVARMKVAVSKLLDALLQLKAAIELEAATLCK